MQSTTTPPKLSPKEETVSDFDEPNKASFIVAPISLPIVRNELSKSVNLDDQALVLPQIKK